VYATITSNAQLYLPLPAHKAAGAGFVVVSFSLFAWMVVIGVDRLLVSTGQSVLGYNAKAGQSIYPFGGQTTPRSTPYSKKMTSVSVTATPKAHPANSSTTNISIRPSTGDSGAASNPQEPDVTMSGVHIEVAPMAVYGYKAIAAYSYSASVDDANELSFTKGEILDIVDNQGKWWQARKADGTIGIVPSNYVSLSIGC
jgi:SHO1 osmosensor